VFCPDMQSPTLTLTAPNVSLTVARGTGPRSIFFLEGAHGGLWFPHGF